MPIKRNVTGFTLIELLVVLFIIGVLSGLLFPNLMSARKRSRDSRRKQDLEQIKNSLRMYYNDNQAYPTGSLPSSADWSDYMKEVPADPINSADDGYIYGYQQTDSGEGFLLEAKLENLSDSDIGRSQSRCGYPTPTPGKYFVCTD